MGGDDRLRHRIAEAIAVGGGVAEMVRKTGIPLGTMSKYAAETSTASFTNAAKIAEAAGIHLDAIAFSDASLSGSIQIRTMFDRLQAASDEYYQRKTASDASHAHMIRLPVYGDVQAAAGYSSIPAAELAEGIMAFDRRFLRDQGASPDHCSVIWAKGDSMTPTIPDGSALIVDRSQTAISNGCIMVIGVGDDLLVKRVRRRLDGLVELVSDNSAYPPETLGPDSLQQLRVVGRVVYFCRTP